MMCRARSQSRVVRSAIRRTRRLQAGALLTVILIGSRLERREDGRSRGGEHGRRNGGRPGTGGARGDARAAARRAPQGAKAELPVRSRSVSRGRSRAPPPSVLSATSPTRAPLLARVSAGGARRAPRALEEARDIHHRFPAAPGGTPVQPHLAHGTGSGTVNDHLNLGIGQHTRATRANGGPPRVLRRVMRDSSAR
jgi:hypothetical protein